MQRLRRGPNNPTEQDQGHGMTPSDLDILVQAGEGTTLEFKEDLSRSFAREPVAFANTVGGRER